jgi:hypothetical protein
MRIAGTSAISKLAINALSAFLVKHGAALDGLMTDILASLLHKGVLSLDLVAQDGIRIRAAATAPSFRREVSLLKMSGASGAASQGGARASRRPADQPSATRRA